MITDTEIKARGIQILLTELGSVGMEKFIALIQREPFDYTKWQQQLWNDVSLEELSRNAMQFRKKMEEKAKQSES
jgi:hypothetical protein